MLDQLARLYHLLGEGVGAASIVVGIIALAGAIAGALVSYFTAGRTVYINAITVERSKWIDKLRHNISDYSSVLCRTSYRLEMYYSDLEQKPKVTAEDLLGTVEELSAAISIIQLQLNPFGEIDKNILHIIENIPIEKGMDIRLIPKADKILIGHAQWLLKIEWEKVKYEARGGLYRLTHLGWEHRQLKKYRRWASFEGNFDTLLPEFSKKRVQQ